MKRKPSRLKRPKQPMPDFVQQALKEKGLVAAYQERPAYQRNDYLMWINSAKRQGTRAKRLAQMVRELEVGGVYMNMEHRASRKSG